MHFSTLLSSVVLLSTTGWAQYVLEDDYLADGNFYSLFSFWDTADPTNGFVAYQNQSAAQDANLISASATNVQMKVDTENVASSAGRASVRITSNKAYDSGLVILDAEHMPVGCGTWPAFWMVGPNWPSKGEIDIIEGVNEQTANDMTLHTSDGCTINDSGFTGTLTTDDCYVQAADQGTNAGCQIAASDSNTYGSSFNDNGGGVYATEWTDSAISIWFFPRGSIPSDIDSGWPEPSSWGTPLAYFHGDCDISSHFQSLQIVFDTTFCGDWAGNVWSSGSCALKADTCVDYVQNNPSAFSEAYWSVNALKVYQASGYSPNTAAPNASTTSIWSSAPFITSPTNTTASSSLPETLTTSSELVPATPTIAFAPTQSYEQETWGWHGHGHGHGHYRDEPSASASASASAEAVKRHLRHHKRHGAGRL
ncbi:hypothetical protein B0A50_04201 [Salinomyces thailandicus]|uniref:endo-1,3(4)-beta-glucanase n=1 Tax=Salinomyces thailandicus TaxID=706561 RepID=A0A4V5N4L8_9PEZI|nr:hypothetical protein B0A50_04201 [Salinomyces thailandica]